MEQVELKKALESFVLENEDLERLEDLLSEVNLFEVIGAVRSEERHSDFLAYLLDPTNNHGLGDLFLKRFVQHALRDSAGDKATVSLIDLDIWDLDDTLIWRERDNIDILLINERLKFGVVIENKTGSKEHSEQLQRYRLHITEQYPDFRLVYLFLTIEGDEPSDPAYVSVTYETVCMILERVIESRGPSLGSDLVVLLKHYTRVLRRHFMDDSELTVLARGIYTKHRRALDFIFEQRPDLQKQVGEFLKSIIREREELVLDHCTKSYVRFALSAWDPSDALKKSERWTPSGHVLLFEFRNNPERLQLALIVGLGPPEIRETLFEVVQNSSDIFKVSSKTRNSKWAVIWSLRFLGKKDIEDAEWDNITSKIKKIWGQFIKNDLPGISSAIGQTLDQ